MSVLRIRAYPRVDDVAKDDSVRATITVTGLKSDVRVLLKQNEGRDLPIFLTGRQAHRRAALNLASTGAGSDHDFDRRH